MTEETAPPGGDPTSPLVGDPFPGEFRLERLLGHGAFGDVWLARDLSPLARQVALKFLRLSGLGDRNDEALALLRNEARILASLRHPNIVQVHAWKPHASAAPGPCLVLQYIPGGSLDNHVARHGPLPWHIAARYIADVADGLLRVHSKGVIHRDIKPANMLLDPESDEVLLTDFGIAARLVDPASAAGTPRFMAPEAFHGEISPALDVYGLSVSLFWLITQDAPFDGDDMTTIYNNACASLPPHDPRFAACPELLETLIRAGLDANSQRRPALPEFVARLRGALNMLLADALPTVPLTDTADLELILSRQLDSTTCVPVAATTRQPVVTRDLKRVPAAPRRVVLSTGDRVRIEVRTAESGYVTVFNIGPTGNLNLLYPESRSQTLTPLHAGQTLHITDVELTPPAGQERLFAVWTRRPFALRLEEMRSLVERGEVQASGAYRATRDLVRVRQSVEDLPSEERRVVVLELDHQ